jgi:hypothetical protein
VKANVHGITPAPLSIAVSVRLEIKRTRAKKHHKSHNLEGGITIPAELPSIPPALS